ncbi:hypothetical protein [Bythopirellula polymerisocia]|uniref:PEP-CTERM protein-sorting domain-containing protein n=1 Tax=Bythopirellula polymerisocia TaxID=2528003 RepID=A0A5C6CSU4_9BACT|nr:hypothetical protein [Bythopirellula polymerisocia]TWU25819.1 hypothetical protein Pla144_30310 [Bythopirellula polymerisocia]
MKKLLIETVASNSLCYLIALSLAVCLCGTAHAVVVVNSFSALPATPNDNVWYLSDMRGAGTASIPDLTGEGGNLEFSQPLPTGAAKLTTGASVNDKAEVGTFGDFGSAVTALNSGTFGYSYYKQSVGDGNAFAAPSLKLTLFADGGTGDNYGTLVYEPNWNQGTGGSSAVPMDAWQNISITSSTGSGADPSEGWWWTGGFEQGNTAGGPPIKSLGEWATLFSADSDFANARVVGVSVGVGTYNLSQTGYFDNVSIAISGGLNETFDFQAVPEPSAFLFGGLVCSVLGGNYLRKRFKAGKQTAEV